MEHSKVETKSTKRSDQHDDPHPVIDAEKAAEHGKRDHDADQQRKEDDAHVHQLHEVRHVHHAEKDALKHAVKGGKEHCKKKTP